MIKGKKSFSVKVLLYPLINIHFIMLHLTLLINICFRLRFGWVYTINTYWRLKIRLVLGWIFNPKCIFIEFTIPHLSLIYLFTSKIFKICVFLLQNNFWICWYVCSEFTNTILLWKISIKAFFLAKTDFKVLCHFISILQLYILI